MIVKAIPVGIILTSCLFIYKHLPIALNDDLDMQNTTAKLEHYRVHCCLSWEAQQSRLPNLSELNWPVQPVASKPAGSPSRLTPQVFEPTVSEGQLKLLRRLLYVFSKAMFDNGMGNQFMIYGGTLLGSYRHHDFIPWDDDIDVIVNISVRSKVRSILNKLRPEYELTPSGRLDKFYARIIDPLETELDLELSRPVKEWAWPFIDVFYFKTDDYYMYEYQSENHSDIVLPVKYVFPLYFRPFGKEWYPAPRSPLAYIANIYGSLKICTKPAFSHVDETFGESGSTLCAELAKRYAFVKHAEENSDLDEDGKMRLTEESLVYETMLGFVRTVHRLKLLVATDTFWL